MKSIHGYLENKVYSLNKIVIFKLKWHKILQFGND
jgi:hypothetical protein